MIPLTNDLDEDAPHMDPRLSPCPHCGALAWIHRHASPFGTLDTAPGWRVECEGEAPGGHCHAMTCWWHSEPKAIDAWNRRPAVCGKGE